MISTKDYPHILLDSFCPRGPVKMTKRTVSPNLVTCNHVRGRCSFGLVTITVSVPGYRYFQKNTGYDNIVLVSTEQSSFLLSTWKIEFCSFVILSHLYIGKKINMASLVFTSIFTSTNFWPFLQFWDIHLRDRKTTHLNWVIVTKKSSDTKVKYTVDCLYSKLF